MTRWIRNVALISAMLLEFASTSSRVYATNGSFLRIAGPDINATVDGFAHAFPPPITVPQADAAANETMARAEGNAIADVELATASLHFELTALGLPPIGANTFTPQVNATGFDELFASARFDDFNSGVAATEGTRFGGAATNYVLDFDDETPQGEFHGFLYIVAFGNTVVTNPDLASATIGPNTGVSAAITIGGVTYTAAAGYRPETEDWAISANLPGGVNVNLVAGSVNHHFDFVIPVANGTTFTFAAGANSDVDVSALADGDLGLSSTAELQVTTTGLAWGIATPIDMPPVPGDFDGDGDVDNDDYDIWSENVGIGIGASGPEGDADLDGDVDQYDLDIWLTNTETGGIPGDYNGDARVDAGDYVRWRNHLGELTEANINNSGDGGDISISDYAWWKQYYGHPPQGGGSSGSIVGVPEPSSAAILMIGLGLIFQLIRKESRDS